MRMGCKPEPTERQRPAKKDLSHSPAWLFWNRRAELPNLLMRASPLARAHDRENEPWRTRVVRWQARWRW